MLLLLLVSFTLLYFVAVGWDVSVLALSAGNQQRSQRGSNKVNISGKGENGGKPAEEIPRSGRMTQP